MSVSHDQLVLGEKELLNEDNSRTDGEPAAISAAKHAAKQILGQKKPDGTTPEAKQAVGLEASPELDPKTLAEIEKKNKNDPSIKKADEYGKDEDLTVPNWPTYPDPHAQKADIKAELAKV